MNGVVLLVLRYDQRELPGSLLFHHFTEVVRRVDSDSVFIRRGTVGIEDLLSLRLVNQQGDEFFVISKVILQGIQILLSSITFETKYKLNKCGLIR